MPGAIHLEVSVLNKEFETTIHTLILIRFLAVDYIPDHNPYV